MGLLGVPGAPAGRAQPVHDGDSLEQPGARQVVRAGHHLELDRRASPRPRRRAGRRAPAGTGRRRQQRPARPRLRLRARPRKAAPACWAAEAVAATETSMPAAASAGSWGCWGSPVHTGPERRACQASQVRTPGATRGLVETSSSRSAVGGTAAGQEDGAAEGAADSGADDGAGAAVGDGRRGRPWRHRGCPGRGRRHRCGRRTGQRRTGQRRTVDGATGALGAASTRGRPGWRTPPGRPRWSPRRWSDRDDAVGVGGRCRCPTYRSGG